jgi:Cd2+/Zn2+-exporting ATPase
VEIADAVVLNDAPSKVINLFAIGRRTRSIAWQNICLALGVKLVFMGLGVGGLAGLWEAVFADVGVALLAVLNATRGLPRGEK